MSLAPETAPPAVTVVANFGMVAGRHASRTEIEKLWRSVGKSCRRRRSPSRTTISSGRRTLTCVHQVSVAVGEDVVRQSRQDPELLRTQLEETLDRWLAACADRVQGELTFAERRARHAVIDKS